MRDLTAEELALAPEWATHYIVDSGDDSIIYENAYICWWCGLDNPIDNVVGFGKMKNRPITGRKFDITQHKFCVPEVYGNVEVIGDSIRLNPVDYEDDEIIAVINKDDVIAFAQYFEITAEDLK